MKERVATDTLEFIGKPRYIGRGNQYPIELDEESSYIL